MTTSKKKRRAPSAKTPASMRQRARPAFVTPMAAQVVKKLPEGDDWIYELKFDGYRALVIKDEQRVELRSRKNKDLTGMYPGIPAAGQRLKADQAVVDGEIVALDAKSATRGNCRIPPERLLRVESRSLQTARSGRRERGQRFPERWALKAMASGRVRPRTPSSAQNSVSSLARIARRRRRAHCLRATWRLL